MTFLARLRQVEAGDRDPETVFDLASAALAEGEEERALALVRAAAEQSGDPSLWQWAGLLNRALDEHQAALECFAEAVRIAPGDAKIAHGHARVALEAGLDSVALFERARALAPQDPAVLLGLTAARTATGDAALAIEELDRILDRSPLWIDGHFQLAQLRALTGEVSSAAASLERAIARNSREPQLWLALCDLHLRREDYQKLRETIAQARNAAIPATTLQFHDAISAGELGAANAEQLLSDSAVAANAHLALWRVRHLLRQGRATEALLLVDRELESDRRPAIWPYAAVAWRLAGDARSSWLEDQPGLVSVTDISSSLGPVGPLADRLGALHARSGQYLDQSVRGGSQTDGPLLSRIEPEIGRLRKAIVAAVQRYVEQLPAPDPAHPLLGPRRDRRIRFSGSWSVRLAGGGRHSNHVHPQGWISSALYLDVPDIGDDEPADAGWLVLGEPDAALGVEMAPYSKIEPRIGQLVLFPSWMWHGTRPFAEGERLTVAFDVAPPK